MENFRHGRRYGFVTYTAWVAVYAAIAGLASFSLWSR